MIQLLFLLSLLAFYSDAYLLWIKGNALILVLVCQTHEYNV